MITYVYLITYSKVLQYFIGLNDPPNIFISSENIFVKTCVSHSLQQSLKQIVQGQCRVNSSSEKLLGMRLVSQSVNILKNREKYFVYFENSEIMIAFDSQRDEKCSFQILFFQLSNILLKMRSFLLIMRISVKILFSTRTKNLPSVR